MPIAIPFDEDGTAVLIPSYGPDGSPLDEAAAIEQYKSTQKHFGKFDTPDNARAYAEQLPQSYAQPAAATPADPAAPAAAPAGAAPVPTGPLRTRAGAPVVAPPAPGAYGGGGDVRSFGPAMQSLEERLSAIPEVDAATGNPLTFDQRRLAESYISSDYQKEQARTEQQRATLTKTLTDGAAMLADGKPFAYDEAQIRSLFPPEKADPVIQQLADSRTAGEYIEAVRMSSPQELAQQREKLATAMNDPLATDYTRRRKLLGIYDELTKKHFEELGKDPAGYVARNSPPVSEAYAAIDPRRPETFAAYANTAMAEQARLGVPQEQRAVLPAGVAASYATRLAALDPATAQPAQVMRATALSFGSGQGTNDYWPQVFKELVHAKLPGAYQVLANMDRPDQAVAADDLSRSLGTIAKKGGMAAVKAAVPDDVRKSIDKAIGSELEEFRLSLGQQPGAQELYKHYEDAATALAYHYGFLGQSDTAAVAHAVDGIIRNKYDFGELGFGTARAPKSERYTFSDVGRATERIAADLAIDQLPPIPGSEFNTPEQRKAIWMQAIRAGGWVNNNDDTGLVLVAKMRNGAPLAALRNDGSRVILKFADVPAYNSPTVGVPPYMARPDDIGLRPGGR